MSNQGQAIRTESLSSSVALTGNKHGLLRAMHANYVSELK